MHHGDYYCDSFFHVHNEFWSNDDVFMYPITCYFSRLSCADTSRKLFEAVLIFAHQYHTGK